MKKWLIRCLTVLAMVCLIPGIVLKAAAETTTVCCKNCGSVETREVLRYEKYDSNSHSVYVPECKNCHNDGNVTYLKVHTGGTQGPTCTKGKTCEKCGAEYDIPGHAWGEWKSNGNGTHTRRCTNPNCDAKEENVPCGGDRNATCIRSGTCTTCGGRYDGGHDLVHHDAQAPTCTEPGWNAYEACSRFGCNYTTYAELPALNHDYQAVTVEPTCETDGYTVFTCSRCKDSYTADPTDQLGHQFGAWSPNGTGSQSASCLRDGCAHTGSTDCRKFTFRTAEGKALTFCPMCGQAENAAQLEKIDAATAWAASGSLSAEDVTARTNGEYLSVAFETAGSLTQPTGRVRLALPAGLLEGKKLVRIAPDGTQAEMPFETERGTIILTLDFANSELPVMLFRLVPQTAAL